MEDQRPVVLVTGATGYVGGRLLAALEERGIRLRCLARQPEHLASRARPGTEIVRADCLDAGSLPAALAGVDTAFYLVHSLGGGADFAALDRQAALNFGSAARAAGVRRIVYLGGLGEGADGLSAHLRSRQDTGQALRASGVPVIELRASIVIGSGSLSYEMVRSLVERLPVMVCPRWVGVSAQPIGIEDLIDYLVACLALPGDTSRMYEIGGPDVVTYAEIMTEYARQRGLRRLLIPIPLLTPRLSSLWLGFVTPLYARVGRALVDSLRNATVVKDDAARRDFEVRPRSLRAAIERALSLEDATLRQTRWCDAASSAGLSQKSFGGASLGSRVVDSRALVVEASPESAFAPIRRIGGATGWYWGNALWKLRGALDLLSGGVGLRRGRRDKEQLHEGDALDFWRVERFEADRLLLLRAEMKLPGRAWLQFEVKPLAGGRSEIRQTAIFDPLGLFGLAYWYSLFPLHALLFGGMLREIGRLARLESSDASTGSGHEDAPRAIPLGQEALAGLASRS